MGMSSLKNEKSMVQCSAINWTMKTLHNIVTNLEVVRHQKDIKTCIRGIKRISKLKLNHVLF